MSQEIIHRDEDNRHPANLSIRGRFKSYNSPFLEVMVSALTMRYLWVALEAITPEKYRKNNSAAIGIGSMLLGILAYYTKSTYADIKTVFAEAVAYERGKETTDVTLTDIFVRSENTALKVTRNAFFKRTMARVVAACTFYLPWHALRSNHSTPNYDVNVSVGTGIIGAYLFMDGFLRTPSFFDVEQNLVDTTMNRSDGKVTDPVTPRHIQELLLLQRRQRDPRYRWPYAISPEGRNEVRLATRIANLLNQTYGNTSIDEAAQFTIGKLNYLMGFGLLDSFPASLGFVELANQHKDMHDVKVAAAAIAKGEPVSAVFARYGIDTRVLQMTTPRNASHCEINEAETASFGERILRERQHTSEGERQSPG